MLLTCEATEEFLVVICVLSKCHRGMEEVNSRTANFRSLEKFHLWCRFVVSGFKDIQCRSISIRKSDDRLLKFGIFKIVLRCLYMVEFTILTWCDGTLDLIHHDDVIMRKSVSHFRSDKCRNHRSSAWNRQKTHISLCPCFWYRGTEASSLIQYYGFIRRLKLSSRKCTARE